MVEFASDYSKMLDWEARAMNTVLWLKGFVWDFAINILKSWTGSAELQKLLGLKGFVCDCSKKLDLVELWIQYWDLKSLHRSLP